jgi:hypothetical protein
MSKGQHDIFAALVIKFLKIDWQPKHITLAFFKQQILLDKLWPKNDIIIEHL